VKILRNIGAVFAGLLVGVVLNLLLISANAVLFPLPEGVDLFDPVGMSDYIKELPLYAFILPILAHWSQAGVGGWIAAKLGGGRPVALSMIVGFLTLIGGVMNLLDLPFPLWMWLELPFYLLLSWGAGVLVKRRRES